MHQPIHYADNTMSPSSDRPINPVNRANGSAIPFIPAALQLCVHQPFFSYIALPTELPSHVTYEVAQWIVLYHLKHILYCRFRDIYCSRRFVTGIPGALLSSRTIGSV